MKWLQKNVGEALIVTGVVHIVYSVAVNRSLLAGVWRDGLVDTVPDRGERNEALWFTTNGAFLIAAGLLARDQLRRTGALPPAFGVSLLSTGLAAGALQPNSGAWLIAVEGLLALRRATAAKPA
jgi:hypothetical protein